MTEITIHTDGGARGNPGPAAIGVVMRAGEWTFEHAECIGETTNNIAEYTAIVRALELIQQGALEIIPGALQFFLDSELVQRQLTGQYRVKDPNLAELYQKIHALLRACSLSATFTHVRREQNKRADALVNMALDNAL